MVKEHPQTISAIIKAKRRMNPALSLKIEDALTLEEGLLMVMQAYYDVKIQKEKTRAVPNLDKIRSVIFWDTDIEKINWIKYKDAVIQRVLEHGNNDEKEEILRFYAQYN